MKCSNIFLHCSIILYFVTVGVLSKRVYFGNYEEDPVIDIGSWKDSEVGSKWQTNSSPPLGKAPYPHSVFVPSTVGGLSLVCNATYPIEWKFHRERWGGHTHFQFAIQTTRISEGLNVLKFSTELSILGFSNSVTGNYTCQKVGNQNRAASLYVFWEGNNSPPYLTLAKTYRKPVTIPFKKQSKSFILPCTVSVLNVVPLLVKTEGVNQTEISTNSSVRYDPRIGYTLTNLKYPYGKYMCQAGESEESDGDGDVISFNVIDADDGPKPEFNDTMRMGAFFKINSEKKEITCCSSSAKPPRMKLMECGHPTLCALAKHTFHTMESSRRKNGSCSVVTMRYLIAGIFRCVGDGIDIVREYFYPMPQLPSAIFKPRRNRGRNNASGTSRSFHGRGRNFITLGSNSTELMKPYFSWGEADEAKMIQVKTKPGQQYVGEMRAFVCHVSHFYYARGVVWGIQYNNGTTQEFVGGNQYKLNIVWPPHLSGSRHFELLLGLNLVTLKIRMEKNLTSLTVYAPIWNSTEWGKQTIELNVKDPRKPTISGSLFKDITWYINDTHKNLECRFDAEPTPTILWMKGNQTARRHTKTVNGTTQKSFTLVGPATQGVYKCIISNVAGNITRTFRVTVLHSSSSTLSAALILSLLGFTAVSITLGFLCNYLKSQKTVISHLTNLAFKDVTDNDNNGGNSNDPPALSYCRTTTAPVQINVNGVPTAPPTEFLPEKDTPPRPNNEEQEQGNHDNNGFLINPLNHPTDQHNYHPFNHDAVVNPNDPNPNNLHHNQEPVSFESFKKL